jgi:hypothetical protein
MGIAGVVRVQQALGGLGMSRRQDEFSNRPPEGITRYVLWALVFWLAVGAFLHADGYFDDLIEETTNIPAVPVEGG